MKCRFSHVGYMTTLGDPRAHSLATLSVSDGPKCSRTGGREASTAPPSMERFLRTLTQRVPEAPPTKLARVQTGQGTIGRCGACMGVVGYSMWQHGKRVVVTPWPKGAPSTRIHVRVSSLPGISNPEKNSVRESWRLTDPHPTSSLVLWANPSVADGSCIACPQGKVRPSSCTSRLPITGKKNYSCVSQSWVQTTVIVSACLRRPSLRSSVRAGQHEAPRTTPEVLFLQSPSVRRSMREQGSQSTMASFRGWLRSEQPSAR